MKLYKHEYISYENRIETTEFEVEEKEKIYIVLPNMKCVWRSRINKDEIGKLLEFIKIMYSLSPDHSEYISKLIEFEDRKIKSLEKSIKYHGEILKNLRELSSMGEK